MRTQHDSREGGQWKVLSAIMEARKGYSKSPHRTQTCVGGVIVKDSITA